MANLDVDFLFTIIPQDETVEICVDNFYNDNENLPNITKHDCPNIFMCSFESTWLRDCPNNFKPIFYGPYVDDIFAPFSFPDHAHKFK